MGSKVWLRNRRDFWLLRAIALIISILLWITVLGGKKVEFTKKVTLEYQLPRGLVIANQPPRDVSFRISGPRAFVKELEDKPMSIPIDLQNAKVGEYEVLIREDMLEVPLGLRVSSVSQSTIPLRLDRMSSKRVPLRAVFAGQLPEGLKVLNVAFKPSTVEIRGAQQKLQTTDVVPTEAISLSPNSLRQEFDVRLNLSDLSGISMDETAQTVHVVVELEGSLSRKWFRGIPVGLKVRAANSLRAVQDIGSLGIRVRPVNVNFLLEGPDKIISKLKLSDIEVWAEIPELRPGNYRARLDWRLAPELKVVKRSTDWADVSVPPLQ